jgi:hypothetical protein
MRAVGETPYQVCCRQLISFGSQQGPEWAQLLRLENNVRNVDDLTPMPHEPVGERRSRAVDERRSRELIKLVGKLRWIGQDDEAKELEGKSRSALAGDCVLAAPSDTD